MKYYIFINIIKLKTIVNELIIKLDCKNNYEYHTK